MFEELGAESEVGTLLWVAENFFRRSGRSYHEVALAYRVFPTDPALLENSWTRKVTAGGATGEFRWFPIEALEAMNLRPTFLKTLVPKLPQSTEHNVVYEDES